MLDTIRLFKYFLLLPSLYGFSVPVSQAKVSLDIGVSISTSAQREAYYSLIQHFEQLNPNVKVHIKAFTSEVYKQEFPSLISSDDNYDVLYWHAGERLMEYVDKQQVLSIDNLWQQQQWFKSFDKSVQDAVRKKGHHYGLPISYYQIGFYYRKSLFERLGLVEPKNWQELLRICAELKRNGIPPIYIGTDSNWPATAWFDYLNLRINGLDFHLRLLRGEISFLDPGINQVLTTWLELIEADYFIHGHENLGWKEGLPSIYRGLAGMSMIGNYVIQDIPVSVSEDIGFFPFPQVKEHVEQFEEAPLDILLIPAKSIHKELAEKFLAFAGSSQVQSRLNKTLGVISPHRDAQVGTSKLVTEAYEVLSNTAGISQFFDRDGPKEFADKIMPIIDKFMLNRDVAFSQKSMEQIRTRYFSDAQTPTK